LWSMRVEAAAAWWKYTPCGHAVWGAVCGREQGQQVECRVEGAGSSSQWCLVAVL
jgi:hypothetical protein